MISQNQQAIPPLASELPLSDHTKLLYVPKQLHYMHWHHHRCSIHGRSRADPCQVSESKLLDFLQTELISSDRRVSLSQLRMYVYAVTCLSMDASALRASPGVHALYHQVSKSSEGESDDAIKNPTVDTNFSDDGQVTQMDYDLVPAMDNQGARPDSSDSDPTLSLDDISLQGSFEHLIQKQTAMTASICQTLERLEKLTETVLAAAAQLQAHLHKKKDSSAPTARPVSQADSVVADVAQKPRYFARRTGNPVSFLSKNKKIKK